VATGTPGFTAQIQSGGSRSGPFEADSSAKVVGGSTTFTLNGKSGRYYVIWITQLPPGGRAYVNEVKARS
jgi:hypothetical protein